MVTTTKIDIVADLLSRIANDYCPHIPTDKQAEFLLSPESEVFYGGAAGGGKSDALLMAALQYADIPGYSAILFRKTFSDLALPGALMDRAAEWLMPTGAQWNGTEKTWRFPSGATLTFGYMDNEAHKYRYQSAEFQFVGFDELTQFSEDKYLYLFSRLRRLKSSEIPLRMRSASNPGNVGHEWVKERFISGKQPARKFIPARLVDNPYLDEDEYTQTLSNLDPVTREQLLNGDWNVRPAGAMFKREWFENSFVDEPPKDLRKCRFWDLAATEAKKGSDPDYTAGVLAGITPDRLFYILDVQKFRGNSRMVEGAVHATAELDGRDVMIRMEQEPGASGKSLIDYYTRQVLSGFNFKGIPASGSKATRAAPLSSYAQAGNVYLVRGPWNRDFLQELEVVFQEGFHDDQADGAAGAFQVLTGEPTPRIRML